MKEKIKILLSLLLVALFAVACSKKKSDNMGLLALLLLGDDSSSSSSSDTGTDITSGFPSELHEVIAYAVEHNHSDNLVSLAFDPWKRLSGAGKVELQGKDIIKFAIVPKTGTMADASSVPIGSYTMPDGKSGGLLSFTSLKSAAAGDKVLTEKQAMGFVAVAATVAELEADNGGKLLKATKSEITAIVTEAAKGTASGSGDSAKTALQNAIEKAITSLKAKITASNDADLTAAVKTALQTAATAANGKAKDLAAAAKTAIAKKKDPTTPPATGDSKSATLALDATANETTSINEILDLANNSRTIKLTADSDGIDSPVYFLYTATEEGTKSVLLTNATKSTAVLKSGKIYEEAMNFTSSYVFTLAACETGTTVGTISDAKCKYDTKKVNWKPTVVLSGKSSVAETRHNVNKANGNGRDSVKLNLASVLSMKYGGWRGVEKGGNGYWSRGVVGITHPTNITISQPFTDYSTLKGTLSVFSANTSTTKLNSEVTIQPAHNNGAGVGATAMSNVSGTVRVTACSAYALPAGCVSVDVEIKGDTAY